MTSISFKPSIILIIIKKWDLHWNYENGALAITLATLVPRHHLHFRAKFILSVVSPSHSNRFFASTFFLRFIMCRHYGQPIVLLFRIMLEWSCTCIAYSSGMLNCLQIQRNKKNLFSWHHNNLNVYATWNSPPYSYLIAIECMVLVNDKRILICKIECLVLIYSWIILYRANEHSYAAIM